LLTVNSQRVFAFSAALAALALACSSAGPKNQVEAPSADDPVVASVGSRNITVSELDEWIKNTWFADQTREGDPAKLYELRSGGLEVMVGEIALEEEAARKGIGVDQLLAQEIAALGPVTNDEIDLFYAKNKAQIRSPDGLEKLRPQIRQYLEEDRPTKATAALVLESEVQIRLESPRFVLSGEGHARGPDGAPITIVEFSDYQCPYCARAEPVIAEVMSRYPEDVRFEYRHLPLPMHAQARAAAEAAVCAEEQGRFWEYHALLFANTRALAPEDLGAYAAELDLDSAAFEACLQSEVTAARVGLDMAEAKKAGISGTPAFFVNGIPFHGARPVAEFVEIIESELQRQTPAATPEG
jgi:protein-disulfide isomerase